VPFSISTIFRQIPIKNAIALGHQQHCFFPPPPPASAACGCGTRLWPAAAAAAAKTEVGVVVGPSPGLHRRRERGVPMLGGGNLRQCAPLRGIQESWMYANSHRK
jgi:hypothetical protein